VVWFERWGQEVQRNPLQKPTEVPISTDLSTLDLPTLNAAQEVIVAAVRNQCCQGEQESSDAAADGHLSSALMLEHWAFAAELLASTVSGEFTSLFSTALSVQFNLSTTRSVKEQMLDALTLEVAAAQPEPLVPAWWNRLPLLGWAECPATLSPPTPQQHMAHDHPDAPRQFGIRISDETLERVSAIQEHRKRTNQPTTLSAVVEDAIACHYNRLVKEGAIPDDWLQHLIVTSPEPTMSKPVIALCVAAALLPAWAEGKDARCVIKQDGVVAYSGCCLFQLARAGSFTITRAERQSMLPRISVISVDLLSPGRAEVKGLTTDGIHSRWGAALRNKKDPACWTGSDFEICAY
jgi:hypothetical protein